MKNNRMIWPQFTGDKHIHMHSETLAILMLLFAACQTQCILDHNVMGCVSRLWCQHHYSQFMHIKMSYSSTAEASQIFNGLAAK